MTESAVWSTRDGDLIAIAIETGLGILSAAEIEYKSCADRNWMTAAESRIYWIPAYHGRCEDFTDWRGKYLRFLGPFPDYIGVRIRLGEVPRGPNEVLFKE